MLVSGVTFSVPPVCLARRPRGSWQESRNRLDSLHSGLPAEVQVEQARVRATIRRFILGCPTQDLFTCGTRAGSVRRPGNRVVSVLTEVTILPLVGHRYSREASAGILPNPFVFDIRWCGNEDAELLWTLTLFDQM